MNMEDGTISTPFELAHHSKPDLRVLFKPLTLATVQQERNGDMFWKSLLLKVFL